MSKMLSSKFCRPAIPPDVHAVNTVDLADEPATPGWKGPQRVPWNSRLPREKPLHALQQVSHAGAASGTDKLMTG